MTPEERRERDRQRYANDPEYRERIKAQRKAYYEANRDKAKARVQRYRDKHPGRTRALEFKRRYGITVEQWDEMLVAQSGRCAICVRPMESPHVDHDHATGAVRDLLCTDCNLGLGKFADDAARLEAAAAYLRAHA